MGNNLIRLFYAYKLTGKKDVQTTVMDSKSTYIKLNNGNFMPALGLGTTIFHKKDKMVSNVGHY